MTSPSHSPPAPRYQELDALRGIAALMVVFFHFTMNQPQYNTIFKFGTTGVDLFFIISGFVIYMTINRISKSSEFVISRVTRLYPTYWAAVTFTFLLWFSFSQFTGISTYRSEFSTYFANMTMFQYYLGVKDLDGPYWTMIIEMVFYISMWCIWKVGWMRHLTLIGLITCIAVTGNVLFNPNLHFVNRMLYWIPLFQFVPLFFSGIIFYKIYHGSKDVVLNYGIIVLCFICQLLLFDVAGRSKYDLDQQQYAIMLVIYFALFIMFVNRRLGFVVNRVTLFLGKISYALYLTHQSLSIKFILPNLVDDRGVNFWIAAILITLPVVIIVAASITYFIEVPLSKRMKQWLFAMTEKR